MDSTPAEGWRGRGARFAPLFYLPRLFFEVSATSNSAQGHQSLTRVPLKQYQLISITIQSDDWLLGFGDCNQVPKKKKTVKLFKFYGLLELKLF
jgi:uncharacterized membrane protein